MKKGFLFILALFILAGCASKSTSPQPNENWRTGSEGLHMELVPNVPPPRLYDDQDLDVILNLENRGAASVGSVGDRIYLSGFDQNIITGIPTTGIQVPVMDGKNQYGPGSIGEVSFKGVIRALDFRNVDKYTPRLLVTSCYQYETIGSDNVCVDPDPYTSTTTAKVCTPRSVTLGGSQGAPVSVGPVEVEAAPGRARFTITVTNVAGGDVFKPGAQYLQKCSPFSDAGLRFGEIDTVQVEDVAIAGVSIKQSCKPLDNGFLRLNNGRGMIYCELGNIQGNAAYTTPLTVSLAYGYRSTLYRDVTIIRAT